MARIEFAAEVADDLDRIIDHLWQHDSHHAADYIEQIIHGIDALQHNPRIGRPVAGRKRELVIGRDASGYLALYSYAAMIDTVFVLAIRNQREAGYASREAPEP